MVGTHNIVQDQRSAEEVVWDSYGTPLERLRRIQLWRAADLHKVAFPPGASRDVMLRLLENRQMIEGLDVTQPPSGMTVETYWSLLNGPSKKYHELGGPPQEGNTNVDLMKDALEGKSYFEMDTDEGSPVTPLEQADVQASQYSKMGWQELKKEAKTQGHNITPDMKRPTIEALLNG